MGFVWGVGRVLDGLSLIEMGMQEQTILLWALWGLIPHAYGLFWHGSELWVSVTWSLLGEHRVGTEAMQEFSFCGSGVCKQLGAGGQIPGLQSLAWRLSVGGLQHLDWGRRRISVCGTVPSPLLLNVVKLERLLI